MRLPLVLFLIGVAVFAAFAGPRLKIHSQDNHFVYLADAFLHGSAELVRRPPHQNDWASYEALTLKGASAEKYGPVVKGFFTRRPGKPNEFQTLQRELLDVPYRDRGESEKHTFVSFPPAPAVLMMPAVAVVGYGANDVLFTVLFAGLNTLLLFLLLRQLQRRGHSPRGPTEQIWLTVLFAFGSAHLWCAVLGEVWFTALIVGVTFHLAYLYFAIDARRPLLAGLCLAAAFSTRATLLFAAVFFYLQLFFPNDGKRLPARELARRFALFSAPCAAVGLLLLLYNYVRFENPLEFGHIYLAGGTIPRIRDYGLFHPHFLPRNLVSAFTLTPKILTEAPWLKLSKHGMSIFLSTPALLWLARTRRVGRLGAHLALTALVLAVPIFLYQNTGWEQFSFRFALDFLPLLICLLALGRWSMGRWFRVAVVVGILVNAFGAVTFKRPGMERLYGDHLPAKLD